MATRFFSSAGKRLAIRSRKSSNTEGLGSTETSREPSVDQNGFGLYRLDSQDASRETAEPLLEMTTKNPDFNDNVDIIAIHGLGGTAFKSWTHDNGRMWLRDFAPAQFPRARIFTFGYDSGIAFSKGNGTVSDFAKFFLEAIKLERQTLELNKRPLILICHSMGGIVAKLAITIAKNDPINYPGIGQAVIAVLFLGTPHQGSSYARYANVLAQIANFLAVGTQSSRFTGKFRTDLLKSLESHEHELLRIAEDFRAHTADVQIRSFVEGSNMKGLNQRIVDDHSAFVGAATERKIPMPGYDHREICRHGSLTELGLNLILGAVRECLSMKPLQPNSDIPVTQHVPFINLPFRQNMEFVGQTKILNELKIALEDSLGNREVALYGLGGIGKSQVALQYAYSFKTRKPFSSIFWVFAGSKEHFEQDYMQIAKGLKLPGHNDAKANVLRLVKNSLGNSDQKDWLMIIDNADDISVLDDLSENEASSILGYIPKSDVGCILYTTRSKHNALQLTCNGETIRVSEMTMADSKTLLRNKLGEDISDEESWVDLLEALECLPLAIVQAASYIRQNSWSVSKYLRYFQSQDEKTSIQFLQHNFRDKTREPSSMVNPVLKTWIITVEQLENQYPRAAEILWMMAFYHRQSIPRYLLMKHKEQNQSNLPASNQGREAQVVTHEVKEDVELSLDLAVGTLVAYSFVTVSDTGSGENYTLHRLVQKFTRHWLREYRKTADLWASRSLRLLSKEFTSVEDDDLTKASQLIPHVEAINGYQPVAHLPPYELGVLFTAAATYLRTMARYAVAEDYIIRAIEMLSAACGPEDPVAMEARYCLARIFHGTGRYREAEDAYRVLIRYYSDTFGDNHAEVFTISLSLSTTLRVQRRYDEAEELATRAVSGLEEFHSLNVKVLLEGKRILSTILGDSGRHKESIQIQRYVWRVAQKVYGPEHPTSVRVQHGIAVTLTNLGELEEARETSQKVLDLNEKIFGLDHPYTMNIISNLALIYSKEGNHSEAERCYRRFLDHRLNHPADDDLEIITCLLGLAVCVEERHLYSDAAKYLQKAYEKSQTIMERDEIDTCKILNDIARLSRFQKIHVDVTEMYQEIEKQTTSAENLKVVERKDAVVTYNGNRSGGGGGGGGGSGGRRGRHAYYPRDPNYGD